MHRIARTERKITTLVLKHICEIEERRLYLEQGFDGIYSFLTKGLGYSEGNAYRRVQSARLLREMPELENKIEEGSLNLSQLTELHRAFKVQKNDELIATLPKSSEIIGKLENKTFFETQKILALEMNLPIQTKEKLIPQRDDSVRLEITLKADQLAELEKSKSLLSHLCPDGKWAEIVTTLAKYFNKKKLLGRTRPSLMTRSALNSMTPIENSNVDKPNKAASPRTRSYLSIHTKRKLLQKANNCCEYRNPKTGGRCESRYQLEIEHIRPLALGGGNEIDNLRVYCRKHNTLAAEKLGLSRP
jgi:hypothetical protein